MLNFKLWAGTECSWGSTGHSSASAYLQILERKSNGGTSEARCREGEHRERGIESGDWGHRQEGLGEECDKIIGCVTVDQ